jgi:hypothetical protein
MHLRLKKKWGVGKDGYQQGGVPVEMTNDQESQTVEVKGTRRMLKEKSKKATWY